MAAQIPIVATTSTPGIVRNSKKRPASPSHNGSSGGGYGASKKKKVSASSFAPLSKSAFSTIEEFSYIRGCPLTPPPGYLALEGRPQASLLSPRKGDEVECRSNRLWTP
uniref:INO80 complex subunit C n=1 Tax=Papio anubis TaxID=9555 RepID=A0A8I5P0K3_PAPAN